MINFSKLNINTNGRTSGRMKTHCPQCHDRRRDKRDRSLSVNLDTGLFFCHYCNFRGRGESPRTVAASRAPHGDLSGATRPPAVLSDEIVQWFQKERGIPVSVLLAAGITSSEQYMPQTGRKELCICFNYYEQGRVVNTKFRDLNKNFKLVSGAELIPYNLDSILGKPTCTIVEGEMDALACIAAGITEVVSVPGGANCNLSWMDRFIDTHFADKEAIYICVDTDRKGQELRDELLRRFGAERCRIVDLSPAKDANEVLLFEDGKQILADAFKNAPEAPLEGVFTAQDLEDEVRTIFENGLGSGADTGWENLDRVCTFELGRLAVLTGIPGAGKSEFVDELILRLNLRHHWKAAYFSPENMPIAYHIQKLAEKMMGTTFRQGVITEVQYRATVDYLSQNICSILPTDDFSAKNILAKARELVHRRGIRVFVLDPVNCIDHDIPAGQSETQYMNAFLSRLAVFARRHRCLIILVAHPRKMNREPGMQRVATPDMYDINGSAAFYNKADFGMIIERNREAGITRIHVQKVKFRHLGQGGTATFVFNTSNGRLTECDEKPGPSPDKIELHPHPFDNKSWLPAGESPQTSFLAGGESPQTGFHAGCDQIIETSYNNP